MVQPEDIARAVLLACTLPQRAVVEELIIAPTRFRDPSADIEIGRWIGAPDGGRGPNAREDPSMIGAALRRRLQAGERISMINPHHVSSSLAARLCELGADTVFLDCEHGSASFEEVREMARAARSAGGGAHRAARLPPALAPDPLPERRRRRPHGADGRHGGRGARDRRGGPLRLPVRPRGQASGLHDRDAAGGREPRRDPRGRGRRRVLRRPGRPVPVHGLPARRADRPEARPPRCSTSSTGRSGASATRAASPARSSSRTTSSITPSIGAQFLYIHSDPFLRTGIRRMKELARAGTGPGSKR